MRPFLDITIGLYIYTILYNYPKSSKHSGNENGNPKEHLLIPNFWTSIGPFFFRLATDVSLRLNAGAAWGIARVLSSEPSKPCKPCK